MNILPRFSHLTLPLSRARALSLSLAPSLCLCLSLSLALSRSVSLSFSLSPSLPFACVRFLSTHSHNLSHTRTQPPSHIYTKPLIHRRSETRTAGSSSNCVLLSSSQAKCHASSSVLSSTHVKYRDSFHTARSSRVVFCP